MQRSLNNIETDLNLLEELASYFYTPGEIALMLEIKESDFLRQLDLHQSPIYLAFHKGRMNSEMELRKSIIKLAKAGSSPAQTMSLDMLNKSKLKMLDR